MDYNMNDQFTNNQSMDNNPVPNNENENIRNEAENNSVNNLNDNSTREPGNQPYRNYQEYNQQNQTGGYTNPQSGPVYTQYDRIYEPTQEPKKKKKAKSSNNGIAKKLLLAACIGLIFGVCFAGSFYGINKLINKGGLGFNQSAKIEIAGEEAEVLPEAEAPKADVAPPLESSSIKEAIINENPQTYTAVVTDVTEVVAQAMPSIVSIYNTSTTTMTYFGQNFSSDSVSTGSGIIVGENDEELLIATNYHVIENANSLEVKFMDEQTAQAQVKGSNSNMDLAVIAVPMKDISRDTMDSIRIAVMGESDKLTVGEPAIAIGNALGYGQSVTTGVISALNRSVEVTKGNAGTFIQTDAAINPGNSGGALLNIKGEVVGINSNKIGGSAVEGMGYAIPISEAKPIIEELMTKTIRDKVDANERGYLGISGVSVTDEVAATYGLPKGVYIAQVYENTGAAECGLVKGDIITALNGESINSMEELQKELEYYKRGDTITITVQREDVSGYIQSDLQLTLGSKVTS